MDPRAEQDLQRHNYLRAKHHVGPLYLSEQLCLHAQRWADHLYQIRQLKHSDGQFNGDYVGQNIYWTSEEPNGGEATDNWYSEVSQYDYNDGEGSFSNCGHFTQVVWKNSKQVGFGYSGGYVVANYYPPGNFNSDYSNNVFHP